MPINLNEHQPTPQSRKTVETAAGFGLPHKMIGVLVGISEPTLRRHYELELERGKATACFNVARTLYARATTGNDLGAAIFFLKSQAGFREKHVLDDPNVRKELNLAQLVLASGLSDRDPLPADPPQETLQ
jgi:hypothetical protein